METRKGREMCTKISPLPPRFYTRLEFWKICKIFFSLFLRSLFLASIQDFLKMFYGEEVVREDGSVIVSEMVDWFIFFRCIFIR